jgi:hypothetical protein
MDGAGTRALEHKRPKEIVRQDPSPLSIVSVTNATIESPLPSMDEVDVYAEATERPGFHVIEVKVNDRTEIRRGIYQAIKYWAIATAWKNLNLGTKESGEQICHNEQVFSVVTLETAPTSRPLPL